MMVGRELDEACAYLRLTRQFANEPLLIRGPIGRSLVRLPRRIGHDHALDASGSAECNTSRLDTFSAIAQVN